MLRVGRGSLRGVCAAGSQQEGAATPASVGIKLAERLQEVASQLQQPAAADQSAGAAGLATPGTAQLAALQQATPAQRGPGGRLDFAADVAAMLQVRNWGH